MEGSMNRWPRRIDVDVRVGSFFQENLRHREFARVGAMPQRGSSGPNDFVQASYSNAFVWVMPEAQQLLQDLRLVILYCGRQRAAGGRCSVGLDGMPAGFLFFDDGGYFGVA